MTTASVTKDDEKVIHSFNVKKNLLKKFKILCSTNNTTQSDVINDFMTKYVNRKDNKAKLKSLFESLND